MPQQPEQQIIETLHKIERVRFDDPWGRYAGTLAGGIEKAGLPGLLGDIRSAVSEQTDVIRDASRVAEGQRSEQIEATRETSSAISALSAVNAAGFDSICQQLSAQSDLLRGIQELLANPLSTAAAERYRRGLHAQNQGWHDHAVVEFDASIEQDPFQSLTHFARGLSLGALGNAKEAAAAFESAMYFTGQDKSLASVLAGSAILGSQAALVAGDRVKAEDILRRAADAVPNCAEVHLAMAKLTDSSNHLRRALEIAPEVGPLSVYSGIPQAEHTCEQFVSDPSGPIESMRQAAAGAAVLLPGFSLPRDTPGILTFHHQWRSSLAEKARTAAVSARKSAEARSNEKQAATVQFEQLSNGLPVSPMVQFLRVAIAICVAGLAFLIYMHIQAWNTEPTSSANVDFKWLWQIAGTVASVVLLLITLGLFAALSGRNRQRRQQRKQQKRSRASAQQRLKQARDADVADPARDRAVNAVLSNVERSLPPRVYPIVAASQAG